MFSLVTALVSPSAIDLLRSKRETLVSTLTENAKVICFQPNDGMCLLQGDWENVKKAYAILEEFYFRAQAEMMVSEMLKANVSDVASSFDHLRHHLQQQQHGDRGLDVNSWSNSFLSSLFNPTIEQSADGNIGFAFSSSAQIGNETTTNDNDKLKTTYNNVNNFALDASIPSPLVKSKASFKNTESNQVDTTTTTTTDMQNTCSSDGILGDDDDDEDDDDDDDDDDDPPVLFKEGACSDVISLSSEMSDPKELDFYALSGSVTADDYKATNVSCDDEALKDLTNNETNGDANAKKNETNSEKSEDKFKDEDSSSDVKATKHSLFQNEVSQCMSNPGKEMQKQDTTFTTNQSYQHQNTTNPSTSSTLDILNQHIVTSAAAAFRTHQFLSNNNNNNSISSRKLPQFTSLLLGSGRNTLPGRGITAAAWQYADLYNMHLSATLQSMHVKQEPSSSSMTVDDHHHHLTSSSSSIIHGDNDLKNDDLGYRFEDEAHLQEMRCVRCNKTYRSEARMKEHVRTHSTDYVPVLHSCPKCSKSFTYRHNMVVHLRRFHYGWQPVKRHACRMCGIKFQKPYLLRLHEQKAHIFQHQLQL